MYMYIHSCTLYTHYNAYVHHIHVYTIAHVYACAHER